MEELRHRADEFQQITDMGGAGAFHFYTVVLTYRQIMEQERKLIAGSAI